MPEAAAAAADEVSLGRSAELFELLFPAVTFVVVLSPKRFCGEGRLASGLGKFRLLFLLPNPEVVMFGPVGLLRLDTGAITAVGGIVNAAAFSWLNLRSTRGSRLLLAPAMGLGTGLTWLEVVVVVDSSDLELGILPSILPELVD